MTGFAPPPVFQDENTDERPGKRQRVYETATDVDEVVKVDVDTSRDTNMPPPKPMKIDKSNLDPLSKIPGMYRLLDLISEQSSGGAVDKIIIDQASLAAFINDVHPGAYQSLTRVDFKVLDQHLINPVGIYGAKKELAALLVSLGVIDIDRAQVIVKNGECGLRSGLYLVVPRDLSKTFHVMYWPQESTWNDDAIPSVRRNRVTFMRYLIKIADQILCIIPPEYATTLVWKDDAEDTDDMQVEDDTFDRLFTFEVSKTNEQEENVVMRRGFEMKSDAIKINEDSFPGDLVDSSICKPCLLQGESFQAFSTASFSPSTKSTRLITNESYNPVRLKTLLEFGCSLSVDITEDAVLILADNGLEKYYREEVNSWKLRKADIKKEMDEDLANRLSVAHAELQSQEEGVQRIMQHAVFMMVIDKYPTLDPTQLGPIFTPEESKHMDEQRMVFLALHPSVRAAHDQVVIPKITQKRFKHLRERIIDTKWFLEAHPDVSSEYRTKFIDLMLTEEGLEDVMAKVDVPKSGFFNLAKEYWSSSYSKADRLVRAVATHPNITFMASLNEYMAFEPRLQPAIAEAIEVALTFFHDAIAKESKKLTGRAMMALKDSRQTDIRREMSSQLEKAERESRLELIAALVKANENDIRRLHIDSVVSRKVYYGSVEYTVCGSMITPSNPAINHQIHVLQISQHDRQTLQMDPSFLPSPMLNDRLNPHFSLPIGNRILHFQIVDSDRFLLVLDDGKGTVSVYMEYGSSLGGAIKRGSAKKVIHQDKIGKDLLIAYDERKRILLVCASAKLHLHLFCFDETFCNLQGWGSAVNLVSWYPNGTSVLHACFVSGTEEVFLIDATGEGRIFSLISQQFRPASVKLEKVPTSIFSSPDGACLFITYPNEDATLVYSYHWSSFGSAPPIIHDVPLVSSGPQLLTSVANRGSSHFVDLDPHSHVARSIVFDITTRVTEFQFKEQNSRRASMPQLRTFHNCLIECHTDVWTRFPVVAAIQHHISGSQGSREQLSLAFATDRDYTKFAPHFLSMIQSFEQTTRKPIETKLHEIHVAAFPLCDLSHRLPEIRVSSFMLGEWMVAFLCLIPIHIAVTRENRFLPLKDGVVSPEWETSLLGADVSKIVDAISMGWYESIFQSYMAQKPVRVVSSMGEQSVGKSYSLNHFVDSSFAGSAMRTTEGVWLSCTPTDDALIVALDFEGVHSIERSAQEDTLLVLFNTALSNLVLFRNNFALSRDITGLFSSFQSSSTVLDPKANPTLFQSTLVIIIKDVVDSDKSEIVKEFSLKFQKIVQEEQDANFISRLHAGRLNIIPWPVIESRNFYNLFQTLRRRLDQQAITHPAAGQFLFTLKTLMAKLKANDWGSISQTLVAHRAHRLMSVLPTALMYGFSETEPQEEPLKNLDTDELIDPELTSTSFRPYFWLDVSSAPINREDALARLCQTWSKFSLRDEMIETEWIAGLTLYIQSLVEERVLLVREWIDSNLSRFTASHSSTSDLAREFDKFQVDLKTGVELCRMKCSSCNLLCVGSRRHNADVAHNCQTSHHCSKPCHYVEDHQDLKKCGYPAGHSGVHICEVETHLCGQPCSLESKRGCLKECTKVVGHTDEHLCPSKIHACGLPCGLTGVRLPNGKHYTCTDRCTIPSDYAHDVHICESKVCPMACELCKRLCSAPNHMHAQEANVIHLCGQEHSCSALCAAKGSCDIETAPHSIKATFTGRHETFEYTKYSQAAKRLKCAIIIPSGQLTHEGAHIHSTDPDPFHFCETKCENCGYYCTLPLEHAQQVHETSHGSMSKSTWAIDGPAGTTIEVDGHKYGSDDDGAPMMCNLFCSNMGRHAHLDYCRTQPGQACRGADVHHVDGATRFNPNPDQPKDWISHSLFWRRSGFKDPYSRDDQATFAKCDAMCPGQEHKATANTPAQPSYCTLPLFHAPERSNRNIGLGYLSHDGHVFPCKNPAVLQQAFHVIFVVDRSGSMDYSDRRPLANTPVTGLIQARANNRLGAVYSALHGFWTSRHAAVTNPGQVGTGAGANRRDAYSVVLFDSSAQVVISNDFTSDPRVLLDRVLPYRAGGGTNFSSALDSAKTLMEQHWSTERAPIVIFLSDGECSLADAKVLDLCRSAVARGKPLSLHSVSFGDQGGRQVLTRMAQLALEIQNNAPVDPNAPANARVDSSFSLALDSVRLADTFLGIAESLRKPRGALMQN